MQHSLDPDLINYPVPGNDDSIKSVRYVTAELVEAIKEGIEKADEIKKAQAKEATARAAEGGSDVKAEMPSDLALAVEEPDINEEKPRKIRKRQPKEE